MTYILFFLLVTINLNEGNQYDVDPQSNLFLKGILNVVSNPQNLLFSVYLISYFQDLII